MANRDEKKCTNLPFRRMQIKTRERLFHAQHTAKIIQSNNTRRKQGNANCHMLLVGMFSNLITQETNLAILAKLNMCVLYQPAFCLWEQILEKLLTGAPGCSARVLTAALFANAWMQPKCPAVGDWTNNCEIFLRRNNTGTY